MMNSSKKSAFTLVEVVVAIAITALLMTAIMGILVNVLTSAKQSEQLNATQKVGHAIINLIQRDLEATYLPPGSTAKDNNRIYFRVIDGGDFDSMDFISAVQSMTNEDRKRSPITELGYRVEENDETEEDDLYVLFRREDLYEDDEQPEAGGKFTEIFDRLMKFNITCFDGTEWRDYWNWEEMQKKLPVAVKFEITISVDRQNLNVLRDDEIERIERENTFVTIISLPLGEKLEPAENQ